ncbi:MAG: hypothetical protein AVDCRST_MAG68-1870 [uncultured Gemmatimonadetes bacterium]|uniref:Uncharacterized protein n=1 Tax=uncultured Gemmatimonadota bacterium TaxID=203437 RepID=A0A6J4L0H1_9BACT|nr:MAG: hypothetical protein AVDCRST_MAG68-1870 [uncultured Gemmatimonadota bacterium]
MGSPFSTAGVLEMEVVVEPWAALRERAAKDGGTEDFSVPPPFSAMPKVFGRGTGNPRARAKRVARRQSANTRIE